MSDHSQPGQASPPPDGDRLDSWKEIAAYLHRDIRTVQRWEKTAGLPVHRHAAARLRTAFAYRAEIDAWWLTRGKLLETADRRSASPRDAALGPLAVVLAGLAAAIGGALVRDDTASGQTGADGVRPVRVLVTPLVDDTKDGSGMVLDRIIAGELADHPRVEVAAPRHIARVLRLMRREAARLTPTIGQEVCVRAGTLQLIVGGRVQRLGPRYLVVLEVIDPIDGRVRRSFAGDAVAATSLIHATRRQARRAAAAVAALGVETPAPPVALEHVTTPSLGAVRLYTAAVQAGGRGEWAAAELLARRALAADPDFPAASIWAAWAMGRRGQPSSEFLPLARRALALSDHTSDREAYVIAGLHHSLAGDPALATAAFEALRRLEPSDLLAEELLYSAYARAGRLEAATAVATAAAASRPDDMAAVARAARALAVWRGDGVAAAPLIKRSRELLSTEESAEPRLLAWIMTRPAFERWLAGDTAGAGREISAIERALGTRRPREREELSTAIAFSYLALGQVRRAEQALAATPRGSRGLSLALVALAIGDGELAKERLGRLSPDSRRRPALYAYVGLEPEAEDALTRHPDRELAEGMAAVTRGFLAARRSEPRRAIARLRDGTTLLRATGEPEYFLAAEELARLLALEGRTAAAIRVLEEASAERHRAYAGPWWGGAFWLRVTYRLAALHEQLGQREAARRARAAVSAVLAEADADHPLRMASTEAR